MGKLFIIANILQVLGSVINNSICFPFRQQLVNDFRGIALNLTGGILRLDMSFLIHQLIVYLVKMILVGLQCVTPFFDGFL